jgi:hypothetical protein
MRAPATTALSKVYGQLKGFSAHAWNLKNPKRLLGWSDGVFAATANPDDNDRLRTYIQNQRRHHEAKTQITLWEPPAPQPLNQPPSPQARLRRACGRA